MIAIAPLPPPIREGLLRIDLRLRAARVLRGLRSAAAVLALGAVVGMAIDFAWALPFWLRWAFWGIWMAAFVVVVAARVVVPLVRRVDWVDLAAVGERAHPVLSERLTCTVALLGRRDRAHGSPALIAALADEASAQARLLDLGQSIPLKPAARRFTLSAIVVAGIAAPAFIYPEPYGVLLQRSLMPWANLERVGRFIIAVEPGDHVAALGSDLKVLARVSPRIGHGPAPGDAQLEWTDTRGVAHWVPMAPHSPLGPSSARSFAVTLPALAGSLTYRVASGSVLSRRYRVSAVEPPAISELSVSIKPPAYTKLAAASVRSPDRVEAWEGSQITLTVASNKPLRALEVRWPTPPPAGTKTSDAFERFRLQPAAGRMGATATLIAGASGSFSFLLQDEHGLSNRPEPPRRLIVRPDTAPIVDWREPDDLGEARPDDVLRAEVGAHDDLAVASAELNYAIERGEPGSAASKQESGHVAAKLPGLGTRTTRGEVGLDLKSLGLSPGDAVVYRVRVTDNRPPAYGGPHEAWTPARRLRIVEQAEPLVARRRAAEHKELQARLDALKKDAAVNRQETEQLRYAADAALRGNGLWDRARDAALTKRESAARNVVDQLHLLAHAFDGHRQYRHLARPARQVADVEAEGGRDMLDKARRASDTALRLADLQQADSRLGAVQTRLDDLQRRFDASVHLDADHQHLRTIAERQEELAAHAEDLAGDAAAQAADRARLDRLEAEQGKLRRDLEALIRQSPDPRAGALVALAQETAALADRVHALAELQHDEARRTADLAHHDATLKALADAQRTLEDDARRLALEVDTPLAENGRGRLNTDVLARAVAPIERGELFQARQHLEEGEYELRRLTRDLEDVRTDPKTLARRLVHRQEVLNSQVADAIRAAGPATTPRQKAVLAERLNPLSERQESIARLTDKIPASGPLSQLARNAAECTARAVEDLSKLRTHEVEQHQREARNALSRLTDALPDSSRRQELTRQQLAEVHRMADEIARDLEAHLRATDPQPGKPFDLHTAANDLATRADSLVQRQQEISAILSLMVVEPRAEPQRVRAAQRARALANELQPALAEAALVAGTKAPRPLTDWHVLGPFPLSEKPPLAVDQAVDLKANHVGRKGVQASWKAVPTAGGSGVVDLGHLFSQESDQAAYGYAEIKSPVRSIGQLVVGSDDTLTVWLNGNEVYRFDGSRSFNTDQSRVEVPLNVGLNRLLVKCGNTGGEWKFAVALATTAPGTFDPNRVRNLRAVLRVVQIEARTALERLEQKVSGRTPHDDLAAELAADAQALSAELTRSPSNDPARAAADQQRIAIALRSLSVPDAALAQTEAVRLAEQAARALVDPKADNPKEAVRQASEAAGALAQRLADRLTPRAHAALLARAEHALNGADAPRDPTVLARSQRAIASELSRLPIAGKESVVELVDRATALADRGAAGPPGDRPEARPAPTAAAAARARAADGLDALAMRPEGSERDRVVHGEVGAQTPVADDLELGLRPTHVADATSLARRERQIRERLQAILGERIGPQEELRAEAVALGRSLTDLRDRSRDNSPRSQGLANAASHMLSEQTPQAMSEATEQLAQGRPDSARAAQRRAAELLESAAQQADDLAAALLADRPVETTGTPPGQLGSAQEAQRQAARELALARDQAQSAEATRSASKSMHQAARDLRSAAQPPGEGEADDASRASGESGPSGTQIGAVADPIGGPSGAAASDLSKLQNLVRRQTGRTWGELPGHLRTEILQMSQGPYRGDYAHLIQLYFREIAAGASEPIAP